MADEIQATGSSGSTLYAVVLSAAGQFANGAVPEAFNGAHWTSYAVTLTEQGTSGIFLGDFPALPAGVYAVVAKEQTGGSPAQSDATVGVQSRLDWSGTVVVPLPTVTAGGVTLADGVAHGGTPGSSTATLSLHNVCLYSGSGTPSLGNQPLLIQAGDDGAPALQINSGSGPNGGQCVQLLCLADDNQAVVIRTGSGGIGTSAVIGIYQLSPAPGIEIFGGTHDIVLAGSHDLLGNLAGDMTGKVLGGGSGTITAAGVRAQANTTKNTASPAFPFLMVDSSGTPATGLTVTATRSIDGGAFGACANAVVEVSGGWYKIDLAAADLNGGKVAFDFAAAGAKPLNFTLLPAP